MTLLTWLLWAALLSWGAALVSWALDRRTAAPLPRAAPPPDAPRVAVIVPARNEAHQVAACLRSLLAQDWPNLHVVCVDDRSTDGTYQAAAAIADPRLTVVRGTDLPPGWMGKNHANAQGVVVAGDAPFLLFTDADTIHAPHAVSSSVAWSRRTGTDLLTLLSDLRLETFWEKALMPGLLGAIVALFPLRYVNDPRSRIAIANGQFLLFRRGAYDAIGGHAAVKDRVADDLELARLIKRSGHRLLALLGRDHVSVRMYTSLREIWWGFVKNAAAGAGGPLLAFAGAAFTALSVIQFAVLPWALATGRTGLALLAGAGCAVAIAQRLALLLSAFRAPLWSVLLVPVSQLVLAGIATHSALRQLTGRGPVWKGREYPTSGGVREL